MKWVLAAMFIVGLVVAAAMPRGTIAGAERGPLKISILVTGDAMSYTVPCG